MKRQYLISLVFALIQVLVLSGMSQAETVTIPSGAAAYGRDGGRIRDGFSMAYSGIPSSMTPCMSTNCGVYIRFKALISRSHAARRRLKSPYSAAV